jgi:predicted ATPase
MSAPEPEDNRLVLRHVGLHKFKAAFNASDIALGGFTVIIGPNGAGKSTVVEALQWLDATLRWHAGQASDRYGGIHDVINVRTKPKQSARSFEIDLRWGTTPDDLSLDAGPTDVAMTYALKVNESDDGLPIIASESLVDRKLDQLIETKVAGDSSSPGERELYPNQPARRNVFDERDRLALSRIGKERNTDPSLLGLRTFWERAVFLRLSPNRLAGESSAFRPSSEPLLDEEGRTLPALLHSLTKKQRKELVVQLGGLLPNIQGLHVDAPASKRDEPIGFALLEKHATGQGGKGRYRIPAPMLSEGTRRLTALVALLVHDPPPSFLCIEEVENGLDPQTTVKVLRMLRDVAKEQTQVVVTTHSPWLLDHVDWSQILRVRRQTGETTYSSFRTEAAAKKYRDRGFPPGAAYVNE